MKHDGYNEFKQRGRFDFPIEFHYVDKSHIRFYMPYHWHIEYEICYIMQGGLHLSLNETSIEAQAGDIIFIRDGIVHGGQPLDENTIYACIVFDMKKLLGKSHSFQHKIDEILNHDLLINKHLPAALKHVSHSVHCLCRTMQEAKEGCELITVGMLYTFLGLILQEKLYHHPNTFQREHSRKSINQLKNTFQLIDDCYSQPLSLADMAAAAGLSPNYFCRFFQKITHCTPVDYLNRYRIERACIQLARTDSSVTEAAMSCGFNDISYFIKLFHRYKGISPLKYQKMMKNT